MGAASYDLFYSTSDTCDIDNIGSCPDGGSVIGASAPQVVLGLTNNTFYFATLRANPPAGAPAFAQVAVRPSPWGANGNVNSVAVAPDGTTYLGGSFAHLGPATGGGVPLSVDSGLPRVRFPLVGGIQAVVPDGAGGWYIGGSFTEVEGQPRNRLAHILADGTLSPMGPQCGRPGA